MLTCMEARIYQKFNENIKEIISRESMIMGYHSRGGPRLCSSLGYSSRKELTEGLLLFSDKFKNLSKIWERSKFAPNN